VSKSSWHRRQHRPEVSEKDEELKTKVAKVVEEHPAYGYHKIKVELKESYGTVVNHKRLRRLLSEWDLALRRQVTQPQAQRGEEDSQGSQGEAEPDPRP